MVKELDQAVCAFCNGKEPTEIGVTGQSFPMGTKCYGKASRKGIEWDESTSLKVIKSRLRFGQKEPLNSVAENAKSMAEILPRKDPHTKALIGYIDVSVFPPIVFDKDMKKVTK